MFEPQRSRRVGFVVKIETGQFDQFDVAIELRIRLAGNDVHLMAERAQRARYVFQIDALTAAERVAAITEQRDAQRSQLRF